MSDENLQKLLVKIVNVDYYLNKPFPELNDPCYSGFRSLPISSVPIIRIFGPTSSGVTTCVHIHGVFPYIFVPDWNFSICEKDLYQFALILDKAINTSFANSTSKTCHVYRISTVLGRPFYGFYEEEKQFLKIEFFNPAIVKRAAELLQNGAVFNTSFQPYEAHVPYILQFFIDNNLYGMNYIALSTYKLRSAENVAHDTESRLDSIKQSYCTLEIDAAVNDIVDLHQSMENMPNNPGLAFIWEEEKRRRRILNESSQITLTLSQDRPKKFSTRTESYFQNKMADKLTPHKKPCTPSSDSFIEPSQCLDMEDTELNTQSRSVLSLLEKLMEEKEPNKPNISASSSPSVVYSDNEDDIFVESSQPVLKLQAENDSILGDQFSDNEIDEIDDIDHLELSQSFIRSHYENLASSDESEVENYDHIPQLDGATSPKLSRRRVSKAEVKSRRTYNLRSKNPQFTATDADVTSDSKINDSKPSPRKHYPQLQIDTQKSPKCIAHRQTSSHQENSISWGTPPSTSMQFSNADSRLCPIDDSSRTDFRRPYPQLGINIKKSPKTVHSEETQKPSSRLRKRKINFNDQNTFSSNSSFDMSSITVKWKKQRLKPSIPIDDDCNATYAIDSDINSQKYSLKIRFNPDELTEKLYSDVLLKKPAVVLKRISVTPDTTCKKTELLLAPECRTSSLLPDSVCKNECQNSQINKTNIPPTLSENQKLDDELKSKVARRKRLGMRMNAQKNVGSHPVCNYDSQTEQNIEKVVATDLAKISQIQDADAHESFPSQSVGISRGNEFNSHLDHNSFKICERICVNLVDFRKSYNSKSEKIPETNPKYHQKNYKRSNEEMADQSGPFEFTTKPDKLKDIDSLEVRHHNDGYFSKRNTRKSCLKKNEVASVNENSRFMDECSYLKSVDVTESFVSDFGKTVSNDPRNKSMKVKTANNIENFKIMNVSVNLKPVDIGKSNSSNEKDTEIQTSKILSGNEKSENVEAKKNSKTTKTKTSENLSSIKKSENAEVKKDSETTKTLNSVHVNESCSNENNDEGKEECTMVNASSAEVVFNGCSLQHKSDHHDKPGFSNIDDDDIMAIREEEYRLDICSSPSVVDSDTKPNSPSVCRSEDRLANTNPFIGDEEIDKIALKIINQTLNACNYSGDVTIKFSDIRDIDTVCCSQELDNRLNLKESMARNMYKGHENNAECLTNVDVSEHFVIEGDKQILSDNDIHLVNPMSTELFVPSEKKQNTRSGEAPVSCSVIEEPIKFTEFDAEGCAFNHEELVKAAAKADKLVVVSDAGCSQTRVNEMAAISCSDVYQNNGHISSKPSKSPCSKIINVNPENSSRINVQENSAKLHLNSKKSVVDNADKDIRHSERPVRAAKSLRWAIDEFSTSFDPSKQLISTRKKNSKTVTAERSSVFSTSLFTSSNCKKTDFETPADDPCSPNQAQTQELFPSPPSAPNKEADTSEAKTVSQLANEDPEILQIYSGSSNDNDENCLPTGIRDGLLAAEKKNTGACSSDTLPATNINFKFDNSIWYSSDEENGDNQVCSVYHNESGSSPEVILFAESRLENDSPKVLDQVTGSNVDRKSSFQETNNSGGSDILVPSSQSPGSASQMSKSLLSDDSPTDVRGRRRILHSTPMGRRSKKSPSPTCTPIYKKLMLKVLNEDEKFGRRELPLENIKEETEVRAADVSTDSMINSTSKSENEDKDKSVDRSRTVSSVGSGRIDATMNDTYGFKIELENLQTVKADVQFQFITVMSMELFVETRYDMNPDPEYDPVSCVFYSVFHDKPNASGLKSGMIIVNTESSELDLQKFSCHKQFVRSEDELFDSFINVVRQYDPDMLIGYEIEMLSWGYLIQRGQHKNRNCYIDLSRIKEIKTREFKDKSVVEDGDYTNELKLVGRIVLNVWRLMRHEIALQSYSFENILFHIMHQRVPQYSFRSLTHWWKDSLRRWIIVEYYLFRSENDILILQQLDFFGRTSELAKLFGIQFYEVLSRGSQFRVESMMLRLAKTQNFVAMSPNPRQRASMRAPESLPLIMEPESKYYREPVIVLDFQSLYPSIIIAYNYCFSTCLGRVQHLVNEETFEFGCAQHTVPVDLLLRLESSINYSPCGVAFVNENIRRGILPAMLEEILDTRLMVKKSMKQNKHNSILQRVLHARQLGLKLIANVTYGYTSANFSGRMPCIEVGDSVVSKGRETLERAIELISANENWRAKVIYGDTDSIFVMVPGRSKEEAFRIGTEIVDAVTNDNPKPVKLKLEKVYYPCLLQTKKRYVGYMYESADQKEPVYDAKGIETVRRDGCPAVAKILEKSLKLLFETNNVGTVKRYVQHQFSKIISGRLSIQELTFAREYRGMNNYKPAACVPALQLAKQALLKDRRAEPRVKERVRYILTAGPPNVPLIRLVRTPEQFLNSPGSLINAEYYITRAIIPALGRCFALMNVNVQNWFVELPRKKQFLLPIQNNLQNRQQKKKTAIFQYFASLKCISCGEITVSSVCKQCEQNPQQLAIVLGNLINAWQRKYNYMSKICRSCSTCNDTIECMSLDCPIYYTRCQATRDVEQVPFVEELQQKYLRLNCSRMKKK